MRFTTLETSFMGVGPSILDPPPSIIYIKMVDHREAGHRPESETGGKIVE
jgi:hypothetical protein